MRTLGHLMFPFAYLPMASGGWTVSWYGVLQTSGCVRCNEDDFVAWLHALCIERLDTHPSRSYLVPWVIMLDCSFPYLAMRTLGHLMFPFAYLPMASGGWTVSCHTNEMDWNFGLVIMSSWAMHADCSFPYLTMRTLCHLMSPFAYLSMASRGWTVSCSHTNEMDWNFGLVIMRSWAMHADCSFPYLAMRTLGHLMFSFAYLPMASEGWTVLWCSVLQTLFFSIPSDADTESLDIFICLLANGEWGVDRLVRTVIHASFSFPPCALGDHARCNEDDFVGWVHALCIERPDTHPSRSHLVPWVIMLDCSFPYLAMRTLCHLMFPFAYLSMASRGWTVSCEWSDMHPSRSHLVPWVIMLVSPCVAFLLNGICVAGKKCFRPSFHVEVLGDRKVTHVIYFICAMHGHCGTHGETIV
ncbi:hypothetical protein VNO80_14360 [Phaseolus coccineus]|uniref:Uncharacterized protein n=1 Tax=Phaseolus coccineus TaxID=3886 RepID=A0AAN9QYC4_PHACN